jgi:hypothetical protein
MSDEDFIKELLIQIKDAAERIIRRISIIKSSD